MNFTTALTVILLAARQLPREFSNRTIYPLLAKPMGRLEFLAGKYLGVLFAGYFCYGLFMIVFLCGSMTLDAPMDMTLFAQAVYLQCLSYAILAAMVFMFSMLLHVDAAITLSAILFAASQVLMNLMREAYAELTSKLLKWIVLSLHFLIPQLTLFDASSKVVHSVSYLQVDGQRVAQAIWGPIPAGTIVVLTLYAAVYSGIFLLLAYLLFRRKAL
jgi:ABC-type transport system involved in multi-copper enzyme maturation permease subunit